MFERLRKVRGFTQSLHGPFNMEQRRRKEHFLASCDDEATWHHGFLGALDWHRSDCTKHFLNYAKVNLFAD